MSDVRVLQEIRQEPPKKIHSDTHKSSDSSLWFFYKLWRMPLKLHETLNLEEKTWWWVCLENKDINIIITSIDFVLFYDFIIIYFSYYFVFYFTVKRLGLHVYVNTGGFSSQGKYYLVTLWKRTTSADRWRDEALVNAEPLSSQNRCSIRLINIGAKYDSELLLMSGVNLDSQNSEHMTALTSQKRL